MITIFITESGSMYRVDDVAKTVTRISEIPLINPWEFNHESSPNAIGYTSHSGIELGEVFSANLTGPPWWVQSTPIVEIRQENESITAN